MLLDETSKSTIGAVTDALDRVRALLDMDVAYVSEAKSDCVELQYIVGSEMPGVLYPERQMPYEDLYCIHIVNGRLPNVIQDTHDIPLARDLKFVRDAQVRSLISVPINRSDGSLYGMFCSFSHKPNASLNQRDGEMVRMFAELVSKQLNTVIDARTQKQQLVHQVSHVIETNGIRTHFQPIVSLSNQRPMAIEALSRFADSTRPDPSWWFSKAHEADLELELELAAVRTALQHLAQLPDGMYMTINVSPETAGTDALAAVLSTVPPNRVVLELTEHHKIRDLPFLRDRLLKFRRSGIGIAIDDLGSGYSGLRTVLELQADVLKLDRELVSDIHLDPAKQALTKAIVHFANETDAFLIAEGIEKLEEHETLRRLGVRLGQGYLYSRPAPADQVIQMIILQRSMEDIAAVKTVQA